MSKGKKFDSGKLSYSLLELDAYAEQVKVLMFGAREYGWSNWKLVEPPARYWDALLRHIKDYASGQQYDEKSGLSHLGHIGANIMFLLWFERNKGFTPDSISELERTLQGSQPASRLDNQPVPSEPLQPSDQPSPTAQVTASSSISDAQLQQLERQLKQLLDSASARRSGPPGSLIGDAEKLVREQLESAPQPSAKAPASNS